MNKGKQWLVFGFVFATLSALASNDQKPNNLQHLCLDEVKKLCHEKCQAHKGDRAAMRDCLHDCRQENKDKISPECIAKIKRKSDDK